MQPQVGDWGMRGSAIGGKGRTVLGIILTLSGHVELCLCGDLLEPRDTRHCGRRKQKVEYWKGNAGMPLVAMKIG